MEGKSYAVMNELTSNLRHSVPPHDDAPQKHLAHKTEAKR